MVCELLGVTLECGLLEEVQDNVGSAWPQFVWMIVNVDSEKSSTAYLSSGEKLDCSYLKILSVCYLPTVIKLERLMYCEYVARNE